LRAAAVSGSSASTCERVKRERERKEHSKGIQKTLKQERESEISFGEPHTREQCSKKKKKQTHEGKNPIEK
jgi:hypothetical protein